MSSAVATAETITAFSETVAIPVGVHVAAATDVDATAVASIGVDPSTARHTSTCTVTPAAAPCELAGMVIAAHVSVETTTLP